MHDSWILSANAGRARIFSQPNQRAALSEVSDFMNAAAHLRTADTETDELGQRNTRNGNRQAGPGSDWQPNQSPAEHQTELFARQVARSLLEAYDAGRFDELTLVASPEFLGVLRKQLDPRIGPAIIDEIDKDYTQLNREQLQEKIRARRAPK